MKHPLEYHGKAHDDRTRVYKLSGDLYGSKQGYAFQDEVLEKIASGIDRIVIDLESIVRVDSSGVGILMAMMWSASQAGAGLVLASLSPTVDKVLSIAMLLDHVDHAESVDGAIALLQRMELERPRS